ncbi:MAG: hypothetical protein EOP49_13135 [Sphingobacteriales bacterium]|nr:MAG: hypothetical protein EOP49_13135 [Sphingobacteriales bacterium]
MFPKLSPVLAAALVVFSSFTLIAVTKNQTAESVAKPRTLDISYAGGCGPDQPAQISSISGGSLMVPLPGWGKHQFKISNSTDSAQFYFNQGLSLFYGFHVSEARSSFQEAARLSPEAPMVHWGVAFGNGPYINSTVYSFSDSATIAGLEHAVTIATDPLEKALIQAQLSRFTKDRTLGKAARNDNYLAAMKNVYDNYNDNTEVATLYADAMMMVNARNWYHKDGTEKPGTSDIVAMLESIIAKAPEHPAALHYYVHVVEPSRHPERAIDEADVLIKLMPSVAHMVHMPSHIYVRTGDYAKGVESNKLALEGYENYRKTIGNGWDGTRFLYRYHNADMQGANALLMGSYAEAKKGFMVNVDKFEKADSSMLVSPGFGDLVQTVFAQNYLLNVRFGKWNELLAMKKPTTNYTVQKLIWEFGQGMANAKKGKIKKAKGSLEQLESLLADKRLTIPMQNRSSMSEVLVVPKYILAGTIAMSQKKLPAAIAYFESAVLAEDSLKYGEPEPWRIPARHFLGQAQMNAGLMEAAEKTFTDDLSDHPANFWACNGLKELYTLKKDKQSLEKLLVRYKKVFELADANPRGAIY